MISVGFYVVYGPIILSRQILQMRSIYVVFFWLMDEEI